jgi:endonuclease-3 related protein
MAVPRSGEVYRRLLAAYGRQGWWPGKTPTEVCVGAVLTQNTRWANVERALSRLEKAGLLHDSAALSACPLPRLERLVRPAGFFRRKAATLRRLARFLDAECGGDPRLLAEIGLERARAALLALAGIGPETADSILLYAAGLPVFVADAYAARVARRHGMLTGAPRYRNVQAAFRDGLPEDSQLFNEYHALLVRVGKERCHRALPDCRGCPLEPLLPEGQAGGTDER